MIGGSDGPNGGRRGDMPWSWRIRAVTGEHPRHLSGLEQAPVSVAPPSGTGGGRGLSMRTSRLTRTALAVLLAVTMCACTNASSSATPTSTTSPTSATVPVGSPATPSASPSPSADTAASAKAAYLRYLQAVD